MNGTKEDCEKGNHTSDNQGLCWWCGTMVNPEWWDAYIGPQKQPSSSAKISAEQKHTTIELKNLGKPNEQRK